MEEGKGPEEAILITQEHITLTNGTDGTPAKGKKAKKTPPSGTGQPKGPPVPLTQGPPTLPTFQLPTFQFPMGTPTGPIPQLGMFAGPIP